MKNTTPKAAVMARVSTDRQLDNTSTGEQLRRGREYCAAKGYEVIDERIESISGAYALARSDIIELLERAEKGALDVIIFDIPDRLGRGDAISKLELLAQMSGARIEYARPGHDRATMEGFVQHSTAQLVSGIERLTIGRRTREGKQAMARRGQFIASTKRPFGYKIVSTYDDRGRKTDCRLEIIEAEAATIRQIYDWYLYGGLSIHGITRRLSDAGVPTLAMSEEGPGAAPRMWYSTTVRNYLHNKTYAGEWHFGKRDIKRIDTLGPAQYKTKRRPESETIMVPVPAIVPLSLWQAAQERMEAQRHKGHKPTRHEYLLRGRVRCSRCGLLLIGSTVDNKYRYYRCRRNYSGYFGDNRCDAQSMPADGAEAELWAKLAELMQDREQLLEKVRGDREEAQRAHKTIETTILALAEQDRKAQTKLDRYLELYGEGGMTKATYAEKQRQTAAELERRAVERAELQAQLRARPVLSPDVEAELLSLADDAALGMAHATFDERVRLLDLLRVEGIYNDGTGELTITGALGVYTVGVKSAFDARLDVRFEFVLPLKTTAQMSDFAVK